MKKAIFKMLPIIFLLLAVITTQGQDTSATKKPAPAKQSRPAAPAQTSPGAARQTSRPAPATATPSGYKQSGTPAARVQSTAPKGPGNNTLAGQYDDLLKHSWMQQGYQVINPMRLKTLWKSVQDSLGVQRAQITPLKSKITEQEKTIRELKAQVSAGEQNLEESRSSVDQVNFLGVPIDKSTYNTIMWGAVITLAAALLIVLFTAGRGIREAKYRRQLYDEISAEYQAYKVKANDKEKKLARELQTERNRVEELQEKNK